ncbi:MAG TPA: hypothetical protein VLK33_21665 [Terriglobales bacterium]|nr:hypothetical protein [Terriglobales bacterium]
MPVLKLLWYYLWIAPHLIQACVIGIMLRRRFVGLYSWFFAYTCFEVLEFGILFTLDRLNPQGVSYFGLFAVTAVVSTILRFGIILEILRQLTSSYTVLARVLKPVFRWSTAFLLIAALALAVYAGGNRTNHAWFVTNVLDRTALILQTGLLLGLFLFSRYLTLSWRNPVFGIALGLGVYAIVDLMATAIRSQAGFWHAQLLDYVSMAAYHCSAVIWIAYIVKREPNRSEVSHNLPSHHEVEAWNQELERLLHQ